MYYDNYYRRKSKRISFADLTVGHSFVILHTGKMPEGKWIWCAFCGGRMKYFVELQRDDGVKMKVGKTCVGKVEITNTTWQQVDDKGKKVEAKKAEKKKMTKEMFNEELKKLLDKI